MSFMTAMRFVDTNVLIYAASTEPVERVKRDRAVAILGDEDLCMSVQILQEFYVQSTRKTRNRPLEHDQAAALVESWLRFPVVDLSVEIMQRAIAASERWTISYWDAAVIEAAREAGCSTLLTEDLEDGMDFDGVVVVNPFR